MLMKYMKELMNFDENSVNDLLLAHKNNDK